MRGLSLLLATTATCATMPTVKLNNGVVMPMVQIGTGGYNSSGWDAYVEVEWLEGWLSIVEELLLPA